jgi:hypothetical protein
VASLGSAPVVDTTPLLVLDCPVLGW